MKDIADIIADADSSYIPSPDEVRFPAGGDVAEILFSTGTTGKSKGIVLTHTNDTALAENVMFGVRMKTDNVEIVPMPLSHSHGLRRTYANLVNGSSVVFADGVTLLKKVFDLMDTYGVTAMDLSPSMLSIIFKLSKDRLGDYADRLDYIQLGIQTGLMAAKVLTGEAACEDLPYETIENYGLYINSDAAAELGITIPDDIAQEAQECAE